MRAQRGENSGLREDHSLLEAALSEDFTLLVYWDKNAGLHIEKYCSIL